MQQHIVSASRPSRISSVGSTVDLFASCHLFPSVSSCSAVFSWLILAFQPVQVTFALLLSRSRWINTSARSASPFLQAYCGPTESVSGWETGRVGAGLQAQTLIYHPDSIRKASSSCELSHWKPQDLRLLAPGRACDSRHQGL